MKFNNWQEMYDYLTAGNDLYNTETGDYVFEYNDAHALCVYNLDEDEAKKLSKKALENNEYWGAFLGTGGRILDVFDYNNDEYRYSKDKNMRSLYLQPSFDYCKETFSKDGWVDTKEYEEAIFEFELELLPKEEKGIITLSDAVRVTDPCYDLDTWCAGTIKNVLPGEFKCYSQKTDMGEDWGIRVANIEVRHKDYPDVEPTEYLSDLDVGVDSGQCGLFDDAYFAGFCDNDEKKDEFYHNVCNLTYKDGCEADTIDDKGFVSASGNGDGSYACFVGRNEDGKVVSIKIDYYPDYELLEENQEDIGR